MIMSRETLIPATQHNVLATGTNIKGEIGSEEDFRIDGSIDGNITCRGKIIVGQNGTITGNITCTNIEIFGQVKGYIICKDTLILRSTSRFAGDMKMQIIEIEPGAQIMESTLSMINKASEPE
ncbi:MAG: polymer-forming cytoskeletal protein [Prevotella sp.]|nr:polymer-forming cytoskeletal protein [Prevotella sp.]